MIDSESLTLGQSKNAQNHKCTNAGSGICGRARTKTQMLVCGLPPEPKFVILLCLHENGIQE